jgi:nucleotide-binding universal stress UspA family protein
MITIQRILCPTDLSFESDEALRYAVALAFAYDAKLFLFHSSEVTPKGAHATGIGPAPLFSDSLAPYLGLKTLNDLKWEGLVAQNVPNIGNAIVRAAAEHKVDLIVMRSRRRPHAAALLGSTAETVSRNATCPVLVTHPLEREWVGMSTGEIDLRRVLVAYDSSPDAEVALKYGLSLAQEYQTELHLLHVLPKDDQAPEFALSHSRGETPYTGAARQLQNAVPPEALLWCKVVNAVDSGRPYDRLLAYAREHEIDLICIGGRGARFVLGVLFGSTVDRVLRQAPCPVLVARPVKNMRKE